MLGQPHVGIGQQPRQDGCGVRVPQLPQRLDHGAAQLGGPRGLGERGQRGDVIRPADGAQRARRGDPDVQFRVAGQQGPQARGRGAQRTLRRDQGRDRALGGIAGGQGRQHRGHRARPEVEEGFGGHGARDPGVAVHRAERLEQRGSRGRVPDRTERSGRHEADLGRAVRQQRQQQADVDSLPRQAEQVGAARPAEGQARTQGRPGPLEFTARVEQADERGQRRVPADRAQHRDHHVPDRSPVAVPDAAQRGAGRVVLVAVGGDGEHRVAVRCDPGLASGLGRGPGELDHHDDHGHDRAGQADAEVSRQDQGRADHERGRASTVFTRWSSSRGLNGLMM